MPRSRATLITFLITIAVFVYSVGTKNEAIKKTITSQSVVAETEKAVTARPSATCDAFSLHPGDDTGGCGDLPAVRMNKSENGRLGNMMTASAKMIYYAEEHNCRLELPRLVPQMDWWTKREVSWWTPREQETSCFVPNGTGRPIGGNDVCELRNKDWFYHGDESRPRQRWGTTDLDLSIPKNEFYDYTNRYYTDCTRHTLSVHLGINETHVLGRACPSPKHSYSVLHVRAGDIFSGHYDNDGGYRPDKVNPLYVPHPTSYYLAVVKRLIAENDADGPSQIIVLCEDFGNPTCEYFLKTAEVFHREVNLTVRVNQPLLDDIHVLLCASQVAVSVGTFQVVLHLSQRLRTLHRFSSTPRDCRSSPGEAFYWIANVTERAHFSSLWWSNTAYQRHLMDQHYEIESCTS